MTKRYYILRYERNDGLHRAGDQVANADNMLRIGQNESCEVRLANDSQYEDAVMAVIEKRDGDKGWKLIRMSPFKEHEIRVNGTPINQVHLLNNGDRIALEGQRQELVFNIRDDDKYNSSNIITIGRRNNGMVVVWLAIVSIALVGFLLQHLYNRPMDDSMIDSAKQSVYQIKVDSIQLLVCRGDSVKLCRTTYLNDKFGTAFLTTEGYLVTARHCIEPWLDMNEETLLDTLCNSTPSHVKMALKAVTLNIIAEQRGDSTQWEMVSYCSLRKPEVNDSVLLCMSSRDFRYDDSRDHIMEAGDFQHHYFWRSLRARPQRTDMMLGDIAFMPDAAKHLNRKGTIRLATKEEVLSLCRRPNRSLIILGRTSTNSKDNQLQSPEAHLLLQFTDKHCKDGYPNSVIAHDGVIGNGFSGGPVLTRNGFNGWRAIGVVSVTDDHNNGWYYSVPVSEIERMNNRR